MLVALLVTIFFHSVYPEWVKALGTLSFLGILLTFSIIFFGVEEFYTKRRKGVFLAYILVGFALFKFLMITSNPYLNLWDEQYHALVAKNMIEEPFTPRLIKDDPLEQYMSGWWTETDVWLHKQPLFLWQMSVSLSLFGVNEVALRLPSLILGLIMVVCVFFIGRWLVSEEVGFMAALLTGFSPTINLLTTGMQGIDHNDLTFVVYVTLSIFSFLGYERAKTVRVRYLWMLLIGISSGFALLTKWLVGLLVYFGWSVLIATSKEMRLSIVSYRDYIITLLISLIIFLPWQVYILNVFPIEALSEYAYNTRHFSEVVERHGGGWSFHFDIFATLYGVSFFLFLVGIIISLVRISNKHQVFLISTITVVYLFFTLAQTKMTSFTFVLASLVFVILSTFFICLLDIFRVREDAVYRGVGIIILVFSLTDWSRINHEYERVGRESFGDFNQTERVEIARVLKNMDEGKIFEKAVVFNVSAINRISFLFYTKSRSVYSFLPTEEQVSDLQEKGYTIVIMSNQDLSQEYTQVRGIHFISFP